ncbi:hypothetical protein ACIRSS_06630 [Amycolatopsis sp. NPDC101161]|uniref:hypothetical protein n=1 Tax=Amycolatopsis sp. NPDC101161 TaxID=3363940 RepID=UPI00382422B8
MTTRTAYVFSADSTAGIERIEDRLNKLSRFCRENKRKPTQTVGLDDTLLATRSGRADAAGMTEAKTSGPGPVFDAATPR